jgi:primosomal protein N' (replication factor Y) (superfamily II helicase)
MTEFFDLLSAEEQGLYVEVVLPLPLKKLFTYRLPNEFFELAMPGKRVFVPFGNRKVYTGIIVNVVNVKPSHYEALNIISILDDNPLIDSQTLEYWSWIADYYMCGLGDVMNAALPAGLKMASETFVALSEDVEYNSSDLDEREVKILEALKGKEKVKISELETQLKSKSSFLKIIKSLYERDLIVMFEDISDAYKPKKLLKIKINPDLTEQEQEQILNDLQSKPKQFQVLMSLFAEKNQEAFKSEITKKHNLSSSSIKSLLDKNILISFEEEVDRIKENVEELIDYELNEAQNNALDEIKKEFESKQTVLLYGDIATGKTFVYIQLIKEQIERGKSVLYLVPELALTQQLINRLEKYFGNEMMVYHSKFSKNEKVEIWKKAHSGELKLIVGPRSALFTPIQNLGLIVIDEEHENTYKQSEKAPRYHARDAAIVLAKMKSAKVLMGTATPSIETYHNALSGKYALVELTELYGNIKKADIRFADIKFNVANHMMTGILTSELVSELSVLQEHKHQAIVFQNRKGFVPMLECSICGWVSKCINCDIALTYYKYSNNLRCHYCGYTQGNISKCQACGNQSMSIQGYGTERITEEIQLLIPELRVIRFDQDSTRQKHAFKKLLHEFESGQADVLVGTQIVVKGLDFSNVYMSAVINADHLLNFPDFRSFERTFQLLTQLAGRAGRREERGILLVQTRNPEHDVLQYIKNYDYKGFYNTQITEREQFNYPPFSRLIKITLKNKSFEDLQKGSAMLANLLKKQLGHRVLGPETPFISRINNYHIRNILIKMDLENDKPQAIKKFVLSTFEYMLEEYKFKNFQLIPDVDPN